jgi:Cytochrome bd terminal oxidase subunit I
MTLDTVTLSRLQFAFTIGFHILWPAYSIGIACFVALLNALWLSTGKIIYRNLMRFWIRLFALGFVMGVVTGVVLSYEIGANWSVFSRITGNVLGPLFMYEALTAFFLEGGYIGIMLFWRSAGWAAGPFLFQSDGGTCHHAQRILGLSRQQLDADAARRHARPRRCISRQRLGGSDLQPLFPVSLRPHGLRKFC